MTKEEIIEYQAKESAFAATPIGKAFNRFKLAHSRYWQADGNDRILPSRLCKLAEAASDAERELRALLDPIAAEQPNV